MQCDPLQAPPPLYTSQWPPNIVPLFDELLTTLAVYVVPALVGFAFTV
jgi:hypothetical protein